MGSFIAPKSNGFCNRAICIKWLAAMLLMLTTIFSSLANSATSLPDKFDVWGFYNLGQAPGVGGFYSADIDGDGKNELIAASLGYYLGDSAVINVFKKINNRYQLAHQFLLPDKNFSVGTIVGVLNNNGEYMLCVSGSGKNIYFYNLSKMVYAGSLASSPVNQLLFHDMDGDGVRDLIAVTHNQIQAIDQQTKKVKYTYAVDADIVGFGHFTSSINIEIVSNTGSVYRFDSAGVNLLWKNETPFAKFVTVDSDHDGLDEVISTSSNRIQSFDLKNKKVNWSINTDLPVRALSTGGSYSGAPGIFYGEEQWGKVRLLDARTGSEIWSVVNPVWGITNIFIGDLDNNGKPYLVWGAGYATSGENYIYFYDLDSRTEKYTIKDDIGPFDAYEFSDVDNDGKKEILGISIFNKTLYVFDGEMHTLKWLKNIDNLWSIEDIKVADVNVDGRNEIVLAGYNYGGGTVQVLDGKSGQFLYSSSLGEMGPILTLAVADLNSDNKTEIIAVDHNVGSGSDKTTISVLNGADGGFLKRSPSITALYGDIKSLDVIDATGDQNLDVVGAVNGEAFIYDFTNNKIIKTGNKKINAITQGDINGRSQIIVGVDIDVPGSVITSYGWIGILDGSFQIKPLVKVCSNEVNRLSRYSATEVLFVCESQFGIFDLSNSVVKWRYTPSVNKSPKHGLNIKNSNNQFLIGGKALQVFELPQLKLDDRTISTHFNNPLIFNLAPEEFGQKPSLEFVTNPQYGEVIFGEGFGEAVYSPLGNYVGSDRFSIIAKYLGLESNMANIHVNLTNSFPVPKSQTYTMKSGDTKLTGTLVATDLDGDSFTFRISTAPMKGIITLDEKTGFFSYEPFAGSTLPDTFVFYAYDGVYDAKSPRGTVTINTGNTSENNSTSTSRGSGGGAIMSGYSFMFLFFLMAIYAGPRRRF